MKPPTKNVTPSPLPLPKLWHPLRFCIGIFVAILVTVATLFVVVFATLWASLCRAYYEAFNSGSRFRRVGGDVISAAWSLEMNRWFKRS